MLKFKFNTTTTIIFATKSSPNKNISLLKTIQKNGKNI